MLEVTGLEAWYGKSHVLHGVDLRVAEGEIVALLGRNGAGRSTTARALMGLVERRGSVVFKGQEIGTAPTFRIARLGLGYVPENREIFPTLSVADNLRLGIKRKVGRWSVADMTALFPRLAERAGTAAGNLSGGEQQMLTLARTMMGDPDLVLIDEPTEGLAPQVVELVAGFLRTLRSRGVAILLIEQKLTIALELASRCYVMGHGRVVFEGSPAELRADRRARQEWLEV